MFKRSVTIMYNDMYKIVLFMTGVMCIGFKMFISDDAYMFSMNVLLHFTEKVIFV